MVISPLQAEIGSFLANGYSIAYLHYQRFWTASDYDISTLKLKISTKL